MKTRLLLCLTACFLFVIPAMAETNLIEIEKVTVTGTGTRRPHLDSPIRTSVVTREEIANKNAYTLFDALEGTPGLRVEEQCSYCNFSEVRLQGMPSGATKILINGLPLFTGLAGVYGLQQYLAANIASLEIVRGAGSSLYGADAVAGVINVITADPAAKPYLSLTTSFKSFDSGMFSLSGSMRSKDFSLVGTVQRSFEGIVDQNGDGVSDRTENDNFAGNFALYFYNPFGFFDRIGIFGSAINETRAGGVLDDGQWRNPFAEGSERIETRRFEAGMNIVKELASRLFAELGIAFSRHKRDATNDAAQDDIFRLTGGSVTNASQLPAPFLAEEQLTFVHGKTVLELGDPSFRQRFSLGVQYRHSDFEQEIGQLSERALTPKNADDFGVFLQDEISIGKRFDIVAGLRFDHHRSEEQYTNDRMEYSASRISPRLALSWKPEDDLMFRASLGSGFRVPYHFSEDLHLCSGSPKVYKPNTLKEESSVTFTGGVQYTIGNNAVIGLDYSMIRIKDKLDFVADSSVPSGYDYSWKNLGTATSHGIDFSAGYQFGRNLKASLSFGWVKAQYDENPFEGEGFTREELGINIMRVPEFSGLLAVEYSPGPFDIGLGLKYTGSMYIAYSGEDSGINELVETPGFFEVDLRFAWRVQEGLSVFLGAKNLLDYIQEDKRPDDAAFMWGPYIGREIYGGMTISL